MSGPLASLWSPAFDPDWAAKCTDSPTTLSHPPHACCMIKDKSPLIYFWCCFLCVPPAVYLFLVSGMMLKKPTMDLLLFQVSYIYALAVFEDYLYATHSDPSKGSSAVELLQIHRFNITAESRTTASLGNTRRLRVYHKLTQPKGKEHFNCIG